MDKLNFKTNANWTKIPTFDVVAQSGDILYPMLPSKLFYAHRFNKSHLIATVSDSKMLFAKLTPTSQSAQGQLSAMCFFSPFSRFTNHTFRVGVPVA